MAAGLRDLLALQGVIPLSQTVITSNAGLTVGQASGVWVAGAATTPVTADAGLTIAQASGVWITGGTPEGVVVVPGLTLNQACGVWINGGSGSVVVADTGGGGSKLALLLREDQEIVDIITAIGPILVRLL